MGLRSIASEDMKTILSDVDGFSWAIKVISPDSVELETLGFSNDISQSIDPDTGMLVSGRVASIALPISDFDNAGLKLPRNISNETSLPWVVKFDDINGNQGTFKVIQSNPDRGLGLITCMLGDYSE